MWDKLFEELNKDFTKGISIRDFIEVDKSLKNFRTVSTAMSLPQTEVMNIKIDDDRILNMIFGEINQTIYKSIFKEISNNTTNTFIDLRNESNHPGTIDKLCGSILREDYKYVVTTGRLAVDISDNPVFQTSNLKDVATNGAFVYLTGKLNNKDIYVDPFMRWNDYKIFLFDKVSLNIENFTAAIVSEATFTPKLVVRFDIDFLVTPSKTINVIDSVNSDALLELKAEHREQQIDKILKEDL